MRFRPVPLAAAIAMVLHPMSSLAAGQQDSNQKNNTEDNNIERIEVVGKYTVSRSIDTATGLGLTLRETPQSVSLITDERIKDQHLNTVMDAVNNTVGVSAAETDNVRNSFYARGFRIDSYQIDGVPTSWSLGGDSGETVADVSIYQRIEFVRGATGLLTGVGDPSASINLVRKHADSTDLTGYVNVAAGRWNKKQVTADVASGLNASGSLRGRLVAKVHDSETHVDYLEENKETLYGVFEADLTPDTLLRVGGSYQHNDPHGATWGALPTFFSDGTETNWEWSKTTGADWTRWESTNTNYFLNFNHTFGNGWQLVANYNRLDYKKDSKLLYVYGSLDKETGAGLNAQRYRSVGESEQNAYDIQLKGQYQAFGQQHDLVIGALYSEQDAYAVTFDPIGGDMSGGFDRVDVDNFYQWTDLQEPQWSSTESPGEDLSTEQKGFYAATRLSLTDAFKVIVGGRVSSWDRQGVSYGTVTDYGDSGVFIPYAGVLYDINEQHRLYASYTEIFKPQNSKNADGEFLDPLEGSSTEIGLKSTFLNDRLHTSLALFQIEQDNLAVRDPDFIPTPEQQNAYYPAQGTESKGFEFEVVGQPVDGWNISAGYSQYKAEDAAGNEVNTDNPDKQIKLFTTYQFIDQLPALTVGGGVNWQNEIYQMGTNPGTGEAYRFEQESYALVNLMARYQLAEHMNLQLNVANLFDKKYISQVGFFSSYRYGTPRNVTLSFNYDF
ncbi:TonB-dependent siderophore receptor [Idiomarina xiamenensis]|uniref:Outer membrane receptor for ferric siderophore n=1 Tax=Idiomarina xiamenensis 10-D-4 TaxID=740709 RepID=K2LB95_9GAMM|nr:TonB-dependent siderophore receptor [Idiomarina xiamenensis]EKE87080.1 Outer membrane receptor for ferric siderophore [Idiomarina xiamenensis 10-D-4]